MDPGNVTVTFMTCPECQGTGELCKKCGGSGQVARKGVVVKVKPIKLFPKVKKER
jgi:DnaJ-class molecular chaperone